MCYLAALSAPGTAGAQPPRKFARIGILTGGFSTAELRGPNPDRATVAAFLRGMRELGYEYGRDFVTEPRGGEGRTGAYHAVAAELVRLAADVIVAGGDAARDDAGNADGPRGDGRWCARSGP